MEARAPPRIVRVDEVAAVPWRNGGGVTRELLAWPDPHDWLLRVSVAEVSAAGPFSVFPGVDRWFAVLTGGGVRLETEGEAAIELTSTDAGLHAFPGDVGTSCTMLGAATRDFNLMVRRGRLRLRTQPLLQPRLVTNAAGVGLFVAHPVEVHEGAHVVAVLPAMSLAWWTNPQRAPCELQAVRSDSRGDARGWWFEVDTAAA